MTLGNYLGDMLMKSINNKKFFTLIIPIAIIILSKNVLAACPTCIGIINDNSPKFFSDDAYLSDRPNQTQTNTIKEETATLFYGEKK